MSATLIHIKYRIVVKMGQIWYLHGNVWTSEIDRANVYDSFDLAMEGLDAAKKFMRPDIHEAAHAQPVGE